MKELDREYIESKVGDIKSRFNKIWEDKSYLPLPWRFCQTRNGFLVPSDTFIASHNDRAVVEAVWLGFDGLEALAAAPVDVKELVEIIDFLFYQVYKETNEVCKGESDG